MDQLFALGHDIEMGRRIRLRRVEIGISQSELGEKLGVEGEVTAPVRCDVEILHGPCHIDGYDSAWLAVSECGQ
jgi:transcriptional regulator with XRE-family HTH domain